MMRDLASCATASTTDYHHVGAVHSEHTSGEHMDADTAEVVEDQEDDPAAGNTSTPGPRAPERKLRREPPPLHLLPG